MVRPPYIDSNGIKKGAWSKEEDDKLRDYIRRCGHSNWRLVPIFAGLARCGKSCRLRWVNYLKPGLKRGNFTKHERDLIIKLHAGLGNKWSAIAACLPGRTDNEVKNYWNAHIQKRSKRKNAVNKAVIKTQMLEEYQPSDQIKSWNFNQTGSTPSSDVKILSGLSVESLENIGVVSSIVQNDQELINMMIEECCQTYRDNSPPFVGEEYCSNFWLCQEYHSTAESQLGDFWAEPLGEEAISWYFDYYMAMF